MASFRKKPGVAFWATVVVVLVAYSTTAPTPAQHELSIFSRPIFRCVTH
jgi:hypothetical protein